MVRLDDERRTAADFLKKRVAYYMIGPVLALRGHAGLHHPRNQELVPPPDGGKANDAFQSGTLVADKGSDSARPLYLRPARHLAPGEKTDVPELTDQRPVLNNRGGSLIYHTPVFKERSSWADSRSSARGSRSISPTPTWTSSSTRSSPTAAAFLTGDRMRVLPRGPVLAKPVPAGEVLRYEFDGFTFVARRRVGSRIRLLVQPINSPYWQKNWPTQAAKFPTRPRRTRTVTVTLYHDAAHRARWSSARGDGGGGIAHGAVHPSARHRTGPDQPAAHGTDLPEVAARLTPEALALPDADWRPRCGSHELARRPSPRLAPSIDLVTGRCNALSRQNTTGLCPNLRFDGGEVYLPGQRPGTDEIQHASRISGALSHGPVERDRTPAPRTWP